MYYFYTIQHNKTSMKIIGYSIHDPRSSDAFRTRNQRWHRHCKKHGRKDRFGNSLITIKVLHESVDKDVMKMWKNHYYRSWDVPNNPKFIHSQNPPKNMRNGKNHPHFGKRYITGRRTVWYTDGINNLFVPEGTAPAHFKRGRTIDNGHMPVKPSL